MPPPPIEDMFSQVSFPNETPSGSSASPAASIKESTPSHSAPAVRASLSPMEATLQAPPEEEAYLPPPPYDMYVLSGSSDRSNKRVPASEPLLSIPVSEPMPSIPVNAPQTEVMPVFENQIALDSDMDMSIPPPDEIAVELPISELWALLLHKWEDTLFSEALLLKQASVYQKADVFYIVFPDHMKAYANSLTERADYKKISKDILTVVTGVSSVEVQTESERDGLTDSNGIKMTASSDADTQPDWVAQMLAFSEATGIPVETLDNL
jgi:hypothetical protein